MERGEEIPLHSVNVEKLMKKQQHSQKNLPHILCTIAN